MQLPPWIDEVQFSIAMLEEIANAPQPHVIDVWIQPTDRKPDV